MNVAAPGDAEHFDWCDAAGCEVVATSPERVVAHRTKATQIMPGVMLRASRTHAEWTETDGPIEMLLTVDRTLNADDMHELGAALYWGARVDRLTDLMLARPRPTACPDWCTADMDQPDWRGHRWHYVQAHGYLIRVHAGRVGKTKRPPERVRRARRQHPASARAAGPATNRRTPPVG
jgi:hypothetical protein